MTSTASTIRLGRAATLLLILGLFTVGSFPAADNAFPGNLHWAAHLTAYALIAVAFGMGWPLRQVMPITALVTAIGVLHETTEIVTHSHGFETLDVLTNALGALAGVSLQRALNR